MAIEYLGGGMRLNDGKKERYDPATQTWKGMQQGPTNPEEFKQYDTVSGEVVYGGNGMPTIRRTKGIRVPIGTDTSNLQDLRSYGVKVNKEPRIFRNEYGSLVSNTGGRPNENVFGTGSSWRGTDTQGNQNDWDHNDYYGHMQARPDGSTFLPMGGLVAQRLGYDWKPANQRDPRRNERFPWEGMEAGTDVRGPGGGLRPGMAPPRGTQTPAPGAPGYSSGGAGGTGGGPPLTGPGGGMWSGYLRQGIGPGNQPNANLGWTPPKTTPTIDPHPNPTKPGGGDKDKGGSTTPVNRPDSRRLALIQAMANNWK